jgi:hypothetical protein
MTNEEFEIRFQKYLEEKGPNPGTSLFAKMIWETRKRHELEEIIKKEGDLFANIF